MKTLALMKMVPDIVGELEIGASGRALEYASLRMVPNESDEHALEEALLLKEGHGGSVTVLALDAPGLDAVLLAALVKGADRAIKITGAPKGLSTRAAADLLARVMDGELGVSPADVIACGVQAIDDLDGLLAPLIACRLGLPFLGPVVGLAADPGRPAVVATIEYPDGVRAEFEVSTPAVFGIQAAERPPRYVPVARLREAARRRRIECIPVSISAGVAPSAFDVRWMRKPELCGHAEMIEGPAEEVSARLFEVMAERDLI